VWLLDTNTCISYLNPRPSRVREQLRTHQATSLMICDIVKFELYYGAFRSQRVEQNLLTLAHFFAQFPSLPFDDAAARICGQVRAYLAQRGQPIGPYDVQIAAIALANQVTLVTHNLAEFGRVPGLAMEDWEAA